MDEPGLKLFDAIREPLSRDLSRTTEPDLSGEMEAKAAAVIGGIWKLRACYAKQVESLEELEQAMLLQCQGIVLDQVDRLLPWDWRQHTRGRLRQVLADPPAFYAVPRVDGKPVAFAVGEAIKAWQRGGIHNHDDPALANAVLMKDGSAVLLKHPVPRTRKRRKP